MDAHDAADAGAAARARVAAAPARLLALARRHALLAQACRHRGGALALNTQTLSRSNTLTFSKAEKFGSDRTPDTHADIQNDAANDAVDPASIQFHDPESAAARFTVDEDDGDLSSDLDPTEVAEAMAHRKRTQVGKLLKGKRRASSSSTALAVLGRYTRRRPSSGGDGGGKAVGAPRQLTSLGVEARLLRDVDEPDRVWTMGRHTMGQGGHTIERPGHEPFPAALDGGLLKGGVRSAHAGGLSTLVVNGVGEVIGFGAGPWRGAIDEEGGDITGRGGDGSWGDGESSLAYVGAPPFRVPQPPPPPPTAVDEDGDGEAEMDPEWLANGMMTRVPGTRHAHTRALVPPASPDGAQQLALAVPKLLSSLKMPVHTSAQFCAILRNSAQAADARRCLSQVQQLECGDDFCVALMENGIVFSWGDGEEGKLGLGALLTQERPTMVDFLLPAEYASGRVSDTATTHTPHASSSSSSPPLLLPRPQVRRDGEAPRQQGRGAQDGRRPHHAQARRQLSRDRDLVRRAPHAGAHLVARRVLVGERRLRPARPRHQGRRAAAEVRPTRRRSLHHLLHLLLHHLLTSSSSSIPSAGRSSSSRSRRRY